MSNKVSRTDEQADDSLEYAHAQEKRTSDDPLAAIKDMRLQQLAACRVKAAEEMQAMTDESKTNKEDSST